MEMPRLLSQPEVKASLPGLQYWFPLELKSRIFLFGETLQKTISGFR